MTASIVALVHAGAPQTPFAQLLKAGTIEVFEPPLKTDTSPAGFKQAPTSGFTRRPLRVEEQPGETFLQQDVNCRRQTTEIKQHD